MYAKAPEHVTLFPFERQKTLKTAATLIKQNVAKTLLPHY